MILEDQSDYDLFLYSLNIETISKERSEESRYNLIVQNLEER